MEVKKLKNIINKRLNLSIYDEYAVSECWKEEVEILTSNIDETIVFFEKECTDEEFCWLSEVFDDIISKTHSVDLIRVWENRLSQMTDKTEKESVAIDIEFAKQNL